MASSEFHHFGVPTNAKSSSESYIEGAKVYISDPETHPYRVEFLRFEDDRARPTAVRPRPHAAFIVDSLDKALEGENVIIPPFDATAELRVAFIKDGDAIIEVMERR